LINYDLTAHTFKVTIFEIALEARFNMPSCRDIGIGKKDS
jgi:hypothetical protein